MTDCLLLTRCHLPDGHLADILVRDGSIAAVESTGVIPALDRKVLDASMRLVTPGLTDPHLHSDKAFDSDWPDASDVSEAIRQVRARKPFVTSQAVLDRTLRLLGWCLSLGTTQVRLHAEVDPLLGLRSVEGVLEARELMRDRMRVQVVAFPQEGIVREPGTLDLMRQAMSLGCDVVGAISYQDPDAHEHLSLAAALAVEFNAPLDIHADFCVPVERSELATIIDVTHKFGLEGRITLGHCTTLARMTPPNRNALVAELAAAQIDLIVLPRTDLYLDGAIAPLGDLRRFGVRSFVASNNVCNPFTPVGRPSLPSVASLYALANREASKGQLDVLSRGLWQAGSICGGSSAIEPGAPADLVIWPVTEPWQLVATEAEPDCVLIGGAEVHSKSRTDTESPRFRALEVATSSTRNDRSNSHEQE